MVKNIDFLPLQGGAPARPANPRHKDDDAGATLIGANLGRGAPSSLVGEGWGGGSCRGARAVPLGSTPTPNPSPQGGGEEYAAPSSLNLAPMGAGGGEGGGVGSRVQSQSDAVIPNGRAST